MGYLKLHKEHIFLACNYSLERVTSPELIYQIVGFSQDFFDVYECNYFPPSPIRIYVHKYISWRIYPMLREIYQLSLPDTLILWFQMLFLVEKNEFFSFRTTNKYMIVGPIYQCAYVYCAAYICSQENKVGQGNMVYRVYNYLTFSNNRHITISFAVSFYPCVVPNNLII